MDADLRYPLHYPAGWQRSRYHEKSNFNLKGTRTFAEARDELLRQLSLLGATNVILSTNIELRQDGLPYSKQKQVDDPGVAVYFKLNKQDRVLACDRWNKVMDNIWAIAKHIDSMRGQLRWGVGSLDQAFMGYQALPEKIERHWWQVLGVHSDAKLQDIKVAYRELAKSAHPDLNGGSHDRMTELNRAMQEAESAVQNRAR